MIPRVLSIAGSDPSGGAGIQADIKSISALGGYAMAAITALTAQNTRGVTAVHAVPPEMIRAQLDALSADVAIDAVKIGMLGTIAGIDVVSDWLRSHRPPVVVLDPVMVATSGDRLLEPPAEIALRALSALADVVTPNLPELAVLADEPAATDWDAALDQARRVSRRDGTVVLITGGHLAGERSPDAIVDARTEEVVVVDAARLDSTNTHGTGCSLSSALATVLARGESLDGALRETKSWLTEAIAAGPALGVGGGHGPVDHFVRTRAADEPARWWALTAAVRDRIDASPFVRALGDGTLAPAAFRHFVKQDALYLRDYARVLARASALAPTREEQTFWSDAATAAITGELELHTRFLGEEPAVSEMSSTTRAYLDHLLAAGPGYAVVVAAVLPCYWIYQDVGNRLAGRNHADHPYSSWLATYADTAFAAATRQAAAYVRAACAVAGADERLAAERAFVGAAHHELAFFSQQDHLLAD
ncbi:bifunctional hydroxymethylpyrimidine kinase/phosphomethylpyrimidine kinase [Microbacterium nymphoidis]|uniref:bifunctional hydroxymethylpyrimidine kinase/phosphomethylpyrimidine kinase n=1 Tax=Microbacterium nymphoidis TaxID=2898586 RepID=UPI001E46BDC6|nr:bifunctional hydroxymethylpyrimidine kinase/phosphomethylpyrimidine kinase [Microbacterium nymphoidis]MCD2497401.1 bifunctional hydroxymethylpyrimidine kinase/phosphomethylpyrimidine kinase [Microbacterium nymphoidis]